MQNTPQIKIIIGIIGTSALLSVSVWLLLRGSESPVAATGSTAEAVVSVAETPDSVPVAEGETPDGAPVAEGETPLAEEKGPVLSAPVQNILSRESTYLASTHQIKELGRNLSAEDVAALRSFLLLPASEFQNLSPIGLNSIKTDTLDVLMNQVEIPEGLCQQVLDMFNDLDADYMWREYCLQFMQPLWKKKSEDRSQTTGGLGNETDGIKKTLFAALDERDEELAATALLGLNRLAQRTEEFDHNEVIAQAIEIAEDPNASARCRLTAMRVAAQAGTEEILPVARELAIDGETDLLRGAAITTLGDFADPQDRELLQTLAANGNRQLAAAANAALSKMEAGK